MTSKSEALHTTIYLLAEHLDMILAANEDLRAVQPEVRAQNAQRQATRHPSARQFVEQLRLYEYAAAARVERAREHARNLVRQDKRFATLAGLFVAGTAPLNEAIAQSSDSEAMAFGPAHDPLHYLRSRGLIAEDAGALEDIASLKVNDAFRIFGVIELGPLVDLCATFLDTLERHYEIFAAGGGEGSAEVAVEALAHATP